MEEEKSKREKIKQRIAQLKAEKEKQKKLEEEKEKQEVLDKQDKEISQEKEDNTSNDNLPRDIFKNTKFTLKSSKKRLLNNKNNSLFSSTNINSSDSTKKEEEEIILQKKQKLQKILSEQTNKSTQDNSVSLEDFDVNKLQTNSSAQNKSKVDYLSSDDEETQEKEEEELFQIKKKKLDLSTIDHSKQTYEKFRKNFYIESKEIAAMKDEEVYKYREELDGIKIWGVNCPKPIKKWTQCGLPIQCEIIIKEQLKFTKPTPIQAQAIPAIMSGRDVIGVAKTGSGKTLAFLLPMFRHLKDQRKVESGEGPIGVVLTPTRELAMQIYSECKRFCKVMGLRVVVAYGGAPLQVQIGDVKRGSEVLISTPGRFIDLLSANGGRVTNLLRCTYLVLDEADRMFDMGFEQQVMKIVQNVRPKAQKVLFSATFPKQMEALARKMLRKPLEITVGGKSVVCDSISQKIIVINENEKFVELLRLLGLWYNHMKDQRCLIFVDRQEAADDLLRELLRRGYPCCSLHGGKEQTDRDSTIMHFKNGTFQIMCATSVAARGLDVKECNLVINYDCPNHMEDYVHRVGRTGRAGRVGEAVTFVTPDQEKFTPDIVKALKGSGSTVPSDLQEIADAFMDKVHRGEAALPSSGFGGKGLEQLDKERDYIRKAQQMSFGEGEDLLSSDEEGEEGEDKKQPEDVTNINDPRKLALLKKAEEVNQQVKTTLDAADIKQEDAIERLNITLRDSPFAVLGDGSNYTVELEINDYPVPVRSKLLSKEFHDYLHAGIGVSVIVRGKYYPEGQKVPETERKLHMIVSGESRTAVASAKNEIVKAAKEVAQEHGLLAMRGQQARYNVV